MRPCELGLLVGLGIVVVLHGLTPQAVAAGIPPSTLVNCQTANPSGAPISIAAITKNFAIDGTTVIVNEVTVLAEFRGATFGPFTVAGSVFNVLNAIDAGCKIFNDLGLSGQILSAIGVPGTTLSFTVCSFLGASHPNCNLPPGTINSPPGWPSNQITGYAQH